MNIKKIRKTMGLTQQQLSQIMGISKEQLAQFETGKEVMNLQQANHLFTLQFLDYWELMDKLSANLRGETK